jgi:uncharacterized membrane protein
MTDAPPPRLRGGWKARGSAGVVAGVLTLVAAGLLLVDRADPPDLLLFVGRFHPVLVHFPIGLLLLAGILELLGSRKGFRGLRPAAGVVLWLGAVSAVAAVTAGYLLSLEGGYDAAVVGRHAWLGFGVAVCAVSATFLRTRRRRLDASLRARAYPLLLAATLVGVVLTGHRGAELTHGAGYLTHYLPDPVRSLVGVAEARAFRPTIGNIDSAYVYADLVAPVLGARCLSCHGPAKEKGGLRLDSGEGLLKGGSNGSPVVAGLPEESDLYRRITLPPGHEDAMPPDGAAPLGVGETELIRWWILNGASLETRVAEIEETPASVETLFRRIAPPRGEEPTGLYAIEVEPAHDAALDALRNAGFQVDPIAEDVPLLQVTTINIRQRLADADLARLVPVAEQVAWLDLGGTRMGDSGLGVLTGMPHLMRLHLNGTGVTDAGLRHLAGLEKLEYLNLYGTRISDGGIEHLEKLQGLRTLYLWQTDVTEEGISRLRGSLPETDIILDGEAAS